MEHFYEADKSVFYASYPIHKMYIVTSKSPFLEIQS